MEVFSGSDKGTHTTDQKIKLHLCVSVFLCVCMSVYVPACMSVCLYFFVSVRLYVCMSVCLCVCMLVCLYLKADYFQTCHHFIFRLQSHKIRGDAFWEVSKHYQARKQTCIKINHFKRKRISGKLMGGCEVQSSSTI